jgi:arylsulfatase A-like enzyme
MLFVLSYGTSDNGPERMGGSDPSFFNSSGGLRGIKRDLYEGGIRVPMIARWPGRVPRGAISKQVWAHWDFFPTALALAGSRNGGNLDGQNMLAPLLGKGRVRHKPLYWEFHERLFDQAARIDDWKAIRHKAHGPLELYDLATDPQERLDVAKENPQIIVRLDVTAACSRTDFSGIRGATVPPRPGPPALQLQTTRAASSSCKPPGAPERPCVSGARSRTGAW